MMTKTAPPPNWLSGTILKAGFNCGTASTMVEKMLESTLFRQAAAQVAESII